MQDIDIKMKEKNRKKQYRLGYDYVFVPKNHFNYKGETVLDLTIDVLFKVFDENTNNEVLFDNKDHAIVENYYLPNFIKCNYDPDIFIKFETNQLLINLMWLYDKRYKFEYKIIGYSKYTSKAKYPIKITRDEFIEIMKTGQG